MGILQWLGFEPETRSETAPEQPQQGSGVIPPARTATFDTDTALTLSAVYRSVSILATAASQLSLDAWRGAETLDPKPALIRKPDLNSSLSAFLESTVTSMAISGNAYWKLTRNSRGEVTNAEVLNPWQCVHDVEKKTLAWAGKTLQEKDFHHLYLLRIPGHNHGLGPIQSCRAELMGARDLRDFAADWFTSGDTPSGLLKTDQILTPEQAAAWAAAWEARDAHKIAVLGNGLDYAPVMLSPKDAQFLESQQFSITQVARLFGIPAHLVLAAVDGSSMTYQNVAQADLAFVRWTLMKYLREIEEAFSMLLPGIQSARFNLDALLRPDTKSRYEAHEIALRARFLTVDEVRALEGLPALGAAAQVIPVTEEQP